MPSAAASEAFQRLLVTQLHTADRDGLAAAMRDARVVRGWLDVVDVGCSRRARELAADDGAESAEGMLIDNGRRSGREARATGQREQVCNQVPELEAALAQGDVSTDHIDALVRAAERLDDAERADLFAMGAMLAGEATATHVESFSQTCRELAAFVHHQHHPADESSELDRQRAASKISRWVDQITGMHNTTISLDPLRDAQLWQLLDAELARQKQAHSNSGMPFPLLQVEALFAALSRKHGHRDQAPDVTADSPSSPTVTSAASSDHSAGAGDRAGSVGGQTPRLEAPPNSHTSSGHSDSNQVQSDQVESEAASTSETGTGPANAEASGSDRAAADDQVATCDDGYHHDDAQPSSTSESTLPHDEASDFASPGDRASTVRPPDAGSTGLPGNEPSIEPSLSLPSVPEVYVHIDLDTLISGLHAHSISELSNGVPLPVSTVRRLCCDATIIPIVLNGRGELLDVGRGHRTATRSQRRALRALYRTCAHPHCTVAFDNCRIHHIDWWEQGGNTDLGNLVPLCEGHHHQVHEGGWTITMTPDRLTKWHHPVGREQTSRPDRNRPNIPMDLFSEALHTHPTIADTSEKMRC